MTAHEPILRDHVARLVSLPDACAVLGGLSRATLYREMARGRLMSVKVGSRSFITNDELGRYQQMLVEESKQGLVPKRPNPGSRTERERRRVGRESAATKNGGTKTPGSAPLAEGPCRPPLSQNLSRQALR